MVLGLSASQLTGQLLCVGFDGAALPASLEDELRAGRRGGAILFRRNLPSLEVAHELCSSIRRAAPAELPPFIAVDQEGGRVTRLPSPAASLPPMRRLGDIGDEALAGRAGTAVARELATLGFNLDFAPVLDVDSNPANPIIGDRSFGRDAARVAALGIAFARGLEAGGVLACGKHFPGHGDTLTDSHLELPHVPHARARLDRVEIEPFAAAARAGLSSLMSAHVVYAGLDAGVPATLSPAVCSSLLRDQLGFDGVLFSDDLEMRALSDRMSYEESAVGAVLAGCDVLLVCHDAGAQQRAHAALTRRAEADPGFYRRCEEAAERGLRARRRLPPRPAPSIGELKQRLARSGLAEIVAEIAARP